MPKLKALSKDEDIAAIPADEPVLVELEPAASGLEPEQEIEAAAEKSGKPVKAEGSADEGAEVLRRQMEDMRQARVKAERERDEARREAKVARQSASDTEADLIQNGLSAAQNEGKAARAALKAARDMGDVDAEADAQERIARAASDVREFERAAAAQADEKERRKDEPEQRQQQFTSVEESIDARADLTDAERTWLKGHQDAWVDPQRNQELGVAYQRAIKQGHARGTPAYFTFIEEFMGYRQPEQRQDEQQEDERTTIVAAPVSRDTRSVQTGKVQNNRVELSPSERQIARDMGISEIAYAKGKLQLAANKAADPEKFARTR